MCIRDRTGVSIFRFRIKDFPIKRRFSLPVLQVNNSLLHTILDVSCTNSEFFLHLRARKWRTQFNSGRLIWISENEAPVRNSINILCNCHLPTIQSMLTTWYKTFSMIRYHVQNPYVIYSCSRNSMPSYSSYDTYKSNTVQLDPEGTAVALLCLLSHTNFLVQLSVRRPRWLGRLFSCLLKSSSWVQLSPSARIIRSRRDFFLH